MKKLLYAVLLTALVFALSSCKKDANDSDYLVKTTWVVTESFSEGGNAYTYKHTLEFKTKSTGTSTYEETGASPEVNDFTYTYDPPTVTGTLDNGTGYTGTVNGNTMTLTGDGGGESVTFTKQ